jgi:adenine phosphoribosyltransferase
MDLDKVIRKVPDFPAKGILFYDITSVIGNPEAFSYCIDKMVELYSDKSIDAVAGVESRGFIFAAPFAERMGIPLILIRKAGKLPGTTIKAAYALEYGKSEVEVHKADIPQNGNILLIDDLLATGGTLEASTRILREGGQEWKISLA